MTMNFEQTLDKSRQAALADEIVTMAAAVVSNASTPDFAMRALAQSRRESLTPEQRAAEAALQAYGVRCAGEVLTRELDQTAAERAEELRLELEKECAESDLALLEQDESAAAEFKSRMCQAIAAKCAELVAAEIDRLKKGRLTILNEEDKEVFDRQHQEREAKRKEAITSFLSALPTRYPSFGTRLFGSIRKDVQRDIEEQYKSPDIHAAVAAVFTDALAAMPPEQRAEIARQAQET